MFVNLKPVFSTNGHMVCIPLSTWSHRTNQDASSNMKILLSNQSRSNQDIFSSVLCALIKTCTQNAWHITEAANYSWWVSGRLALFLKGFHSGMSIAQCVWYDEHTHTQSLTGTHIYKQKHSKHTYTLLLVPFLHKESLVLGALIFLLKVY